MGTAKEQQLYNRRRSSKKCEKMKLAFVGLLLLAVMAVTVYGGPGGGGETNKEDRRDCIVDRPKKAKKCNRIKGVCRFQSDCHSDENHVPGKWCKGKHTKCCRPNQECENYAGGHCRPNNQCHPGEQHPGPHPGGQPWCEGPQMRCCVKS